MLRRTSFELFYFQATAAAPQSDHIKMLDGGVLPKLRGTLTSCDIHLPCDFVDENAACSVHSACAGII
jgi:hypothetical protein